MKRLRKRMSHKALISFMDKRKIRKLVFAEWVPTETSDPESTQHVTDVMALGGSMQIQYQDGGVRTIFPYGWNTSKEGNVLIMCYKDDGGLRSYRLDRIQKFFFDSSTMEVEILDEVPSAEESNPSLEISDYGEETTQENQLPEQPLDNTQVENIVPNELPLDNALQTMEQPASPVQKEQENEQPQLEIKDYNEDDDEELPRAAQFRSRLRKKIKSRLIK